MGSSSDNGLKLKVPCPKSNVCMYEGGVVKWLSIFMWKNVAEHEKT